MPLFKVDSVVLLKPKKKHAETREQYRSLKASLGRGMQLKDAVRLPPGEDPNVWIAMNTMELYNTTFLCFGIVTGTCTTRSCPKMTAGPRYEFLWTDKGTKANVSLPAPVYIDNLADWVHEQINDPAVFPPNSRAYPKTFIPTCSKILSRLFRVFAHMYHHHFDDLRRLGAEAHFNTTLKHFYFFVSEFHLVEPAALDPLAAVLSTFV
ncbi:MOB kinase activator 3A [Pelomyxa schiedti]|nr:MOB kinase activator 3A [Pelomyxa schiedti]